MRTIYFDYNATTPLDAEVKAEMEPFLGPLFGNPSSVHRIGRKARAALDDARDRVARVWHCKPSEVVFTSGGTECNNHAIFGSARSLRPKGKHIITSQIEHHAVLHCFEYLQKHEGFDVTYLPVNQDGLVSPENLIPAIRPDTTLVSVMAVNNETGTIQPVAELGAICRERGVLFHTDAAQWFGKEPFADIHQFNADFVTLCAHKFHGPKGAGALFIRSPLMIESLLLGGSHENERRAGTENVPAIIGLAKAVELFVREPVFATQPMRAWTEDLASLAHTVNGVTVRGSLTRRTASTIAFTAAGCDSIALLAGLDMEGVCASSGSACAAGSLEPSHVMTALGVNKNEANSLVRFSLGRENTAEDVATVKTAFANVINRVRGV